MPIYEYQCEKCNKVHEFWQKISETPIKECPECNGVLHKLVSLSSFQLKGGGWYVDGYNGSNVGKEKNNPEKQANVTKQEGAPPPRNKATN